MDGDTLLLEEWIPESRRYTGERLRVEVTYLVRQPWLPEGTVAMGVRIADNQVVTDETRYRFPVKAARVSSYANGGKLVLGHAVVDWTGARVCETEQGSEAQRLAALVNAATDWADAVAHRGSSTSERVTADAAQALLNAVNALMQPVEPVEEDEVPF
jgi:hypothetical protein